MRFRNKFGILVFLFFGVIIWVLGRGYLNTSSTFKFEFTDNFVDNGLQEIIRRDLQGKEGTFAIYIENLEGREKYAVLPEDSFPAASLYKLVLLAAAEKSIEQGSLKPEQRITSTKSHLEKVFGGVDFGYEEAPEELGYSVEETLRRIGSISDNFAAIMLTEKLRSVSSGDPLTEMARELGMSGTTFAGVPSTTASDIAGFFKLLYQGKVVSKTASEEIIRLLRGSKINDRIPAKLPKELMVVHKTGELSRLRHDAGIVYLENPENISSQSASPKKAYIIVLLSKDLKYEDEGVETLAQISKDVYEYFKGK